MKKRFFIAGTDTEVGKTYVSVQLLRHYAAQGYSTIGVKPLASGAKMTAQGLRNEDALQLQAASTLNLSYQQINPYCYEPPISPNIAATNRLTVSEIKQSLAWMETHPADIIIVEGAGGWLCPINKHETYADLAVALNLEVLLVVGLKLGCINHSLLTHREVIHSGANYAGWLANEVNPTMLAKEQNIATIREHLGRENYRFSYQG